MDRTEVRRDVCHIILLIRLGRRVSFENKGRSFVVKGLNTGKMQSRAVQLHEASSVMSDVHPIREMPNKQP